MKMSLKVNAAIGAVIIFWHAEGFLPSFVSYITVIDFRSNFQPTWLTRKRAKASHASKLAFCDVCMCGKKSQFYVPWTCLCLHDV
jgi:hypothetical protein